MRWKQCKKNVIGRLYGVLSIVRKQYVGLCLTGVLGWGACQPIQATCATFRENETAQTSRKNALLWKISGNGLQKPSYLFGTHHLSSLSICDSIKGFYPAFNQTEQLYGEIVLDTLSPTAVKQLQTIIMMPSDTLLSTLYTPEDYQLISDTLQASLQLDIDRLKHFKPFVINSLYTIKLHQNLPMTSSQTKIDNELQELAKSAGKKVSGLEEINDVAKLLYNRPLKEQAELLLQCIKHPDQLNIGLQHLADAYTNQDLDQLHKATSPTDSSAYATFVHQTLIIQRNQNWLKLIPGVMAEKPTFFVVGVGHLPGKEGLLSQLETAGYRVEPIE